MSKENNNNDLVKAAQILLTATADQKDEMRQGVYDNARLAINLLEKYHCVTLKQLSTLRKNHEKLQQEVMHVKLSIGQKRWYEIVKEAKSQDTNQDRSSYRPPGHGNRSTPPGPMLDKSGETAE